MSPAMTAFIDANQPVTAKQVALALGITHQAVYEQHAAQALHINDWTRSTRGHAAALYVLGKGRDAKRPGPMGQPERDNAYRQRHRPSKTMTRLGVWAGLLGAAA